MDKYTVKRLISETPSKKVYLVTDKETNKNYFMEIVQASLDSNNLELIGAVFAPFHTNTVKCHKLATNEKECIILMKHHQGKPFINPKAPTCAHSLKTTRRGRRRSRRTGYGSWWGTFSSGCTSCTRTR